MEKSEKVNSFKQDECLVTSYDNGKIVDTFVCPFDKLLDYVKPLRTFAVQRVKHLV